MLRLASSYWNSPDWPQRREETLALLEAGSAAGDVSARRSLASAMARGWFGLRRIPKGILLRFSVAGEMADLVKDETAIVQSDSKTRPRFFSRLAAQPWLSGATRHQAS
jgi:hypothetical protein